MPTHPYSGASKTVTSAPVTSAPVRSAWSRSVSPDLSLSNAPLSNELPTDSSLQDDSNTEAAILCLESLVHRRTGEHLSDLQRVILRLGLKGKRYLEIADVYGCTEGHAKDVGAQLWRALSRALGEKVTKQNLRSAVARCVNRARRLKRQAITSTLTQPTVFLDPAAPKLFQWSWDKPQ